MKFRYYWLAVLMVYNCAAFFNELNEQTTFITSFKIEKSKNPGLTQDYEGYIDTFNYRVVVDFKSSSIATSTLKSIIPTISYLSREIYPSPDEPIDLNGTTSYTLKTLKREKEWKIAACCTNNNSGPTLVYTDAWEHTMATGAVTAQMGDGIIKSDGANEKLYLIGSQNGGTLDTYIEKINLTTGAVELSNTISNYAAKSFGDKYLTAAFYLSVYNGTDTQIRQVNTNTLNHTLEATLTSLQNVEVLSLPNAGGTRVKGMLGTAGGDDRIFNAYNHTIDTVLLDCNTTTEIAPLFGAPDFARETFYSVGLTQNCGSVSSGTDIFIGRWDNSILPSLTWKRSMWTSFNDSLPQIGFKRAAIVTSDGSVIINRFYSNAGTYSAPGKFDLNGNDITASTNFANFPAYFWNSKILLVAMGLYNYNNSTDIFYSATNILSSVPSVVRSDSDGNIRPITFNPSFSVGCNTSMQTITVSVDSGYNLYFNCLKTNSGTGLKEVYVKKFKATVVQ